MAELSVDQALLKAKSHAEKGEIEEAQKLYQVVLQAFPKNKQAQQGSAALNKLKQAVSKKGPPQDTINQLMNFYNQGQLVAVVEQATTLTKQYPRAFIVWNILGAANKGLGRVHAASKAFEKVTELHPTYADGLNNLGVTLKDQGKLDQAIAAYKKALSLRPDYVEAFNNMGNALKEQCKLEEAIKAYNKVLSLKPDYHSAHSNLGVVLHDQGKLEEAIKAFNKAISLKPDYAEAYNNMGISLRNQGKLEEAIEAYNKALEFKPDYAEAFSNMSNAFHDQGRLEEAIEAFNKARSLKPDYAELYHNMGNVLRNQGKLEEAIEAYNKALALKPDYPEAYINLSNALHDQGKLDESIEACNIAINFDRVSFISYSSLIHQAAIMCNWQKFERRSLEIYLAKSNRDKIKYPMDAFPFLHCESSPDTQLRVSKLFAKNTFKNRILLPIESPKTKPPLLRIGYFSPDFREHPVAQMIEGVLRYHDRSKFQIFAYSFSQISDGEMREKIERSVDTFRDVKAKSAADIAQLAREDRIDIALDLTGYTRNNRANIFNQRAAPIQINYLGYPGTMGANFMDYIIADKVLIPKEMERYYSEKIIFMPDSYQPTNDNLVISEYIPTRKKLGLPENGFIFCAINQSYKIKTEEFDIWMRLLLKIEDSVLWLKKQNKWMVSNLKHEAQKRGVNPTRLIFAKQVPHKKYLAQFKQADLFLDTFNYNAGTTASDVLMAGLPVVTKMGQSYASRMAASLLNVVDMNDLVTQTQEEYEALALDLALRPKRLLEIRERLKKNTRTSPFFNTKLYTCHLESAYQQAYENYYSHNSAKNIEVKSTLPSKKVDNFR